MVEQALAHVDPYGLRPIHVSFDIDSCDPSVAPATGTPVKGAFGCAVFPPQLCVA